MTQQELPAGAGARQGALAVIYAFRSPGSGAVYIGKHNCDPTGWPRRGGGKLPDGYSGSGKIVSRFHRRHGSFVEWRLLSVIGGTPDQVNEAERRAIRLTRRIFSRLCVNVLDGGEGHTSASAIAANADPILRARRIDALKAHAKTTIGKEQSARRFAASKTPAALAKLSRSHKEFYRSAEGAAKIAYAREVGSRPEALKRRANGIKAACASPEARERLAKASKAGKTKEAVARQIWTMRERKVKSSGASSRFIGVNVHKPGVYRAKIKVSGKTTHLGLFASESEAAKAYDRAVLTHYGPGARLNFPVDSPA